MSTYQPYPSSPRPSAEPAPPVAPARRLVRRRHDKVVAGVCGGLADYLRVDANLIRIALVAAVVLGAGSGIVAYLVAWWLMPRG
ncbi:PspC domain-containing protein [Nocardioides sp. SYSU DS0651]|uniref:PspC domain-containing protein n=1 Tax=Nocardioides sp. SYSU DS0651 TaxID=3415955 RepID=UPI003F4C6901